MESVTESLVSGIPEKIKFIIGPPAMSGLELASETLLITVHSQDEAFLLSLIVKSLNKRWQTLDLVSMMKELKRSWYGRSVHNEKLRLRITDRLLSLPRFRKEDEQTD